MGWVKRYNGCLGRHSERDWVQEERQGKGGRGFDSIPPYFQAPLTTPYFWRVEPSTLQVKRAFLSSALAEFTAVEARVRGAWREESAESTEADMCNDELFLRLYHAPSHSMTTHSEENISSILRLKVRRITIKVRSRPPLWSSGQSSRLQIQRSGFDSLRYQIFWEMVGLQRGLLSLVSTIEQLLGRKSSGFGLENRDYGRRRSAALTARHPSLCKSWH
jgi:hypothetical protein